MVQTGSKQLRLAETTSGYFRPVESTYRVLTKLTESLVWVSGPVKASIDQYSQEEARSQIQRYTCVQCMLGVYPVLAKLVQYAIMYLDRSRCRGK